MELKEQLESHGFRVATVKEDIFDYRFLDGTAMLNHFFIKMAFLSSWKEITPVERWPEVFQKIEGKLNDKAKRSRIPYDAGSVCDHGLRKGG